MFDENESDAGNARWFVQLQDGTVRFVSERGAWLIFDGAIWRQDVDGKIERLAKAAITAMLKDFDQISRDKLDKLWKHVLRSEQAPRIGAMLQLARSEPGITLAQARLDADPFLLGTSLGVIDLRTGKLAATCSTTSYVAREIGCEFNPHANCPTWLAFLQRTMADDAALIEFLQRAVGYSLTGDTSEQCIFIGHGPGANGKSVFARTIRELVGAYGVDTHVDTFLDRREGSASNDLAQLAGVRFVCASEMDEGKRLAESLIKAATGGEALSARFLFREFFSFVPSFKVWLHVNHKPRVTGDDNGIWRRIRLIPWRVTIPEDEQDRGLLDKLRRELPGILNWALEGCLAWQRHGLQSPAAVLAATDAYRAESDAIGEWITERCVTAPAISTQAKRLYDDYRSYTDGRGGMPLSMKRWAQRMADRGFVKDEGRIVHYRDIGLCDLRDLCGQIPEPSSYTHTREDLQEKGRNGRNGRNDWDATNPTRYRTIARPPLSLTPRAQTTGDRPRGRA